VKYSLKITSFRVDQPATFVYR